MVLHQGIVHGDDDGKHFDCTRCGQTFVTEIKLLNHESHGHESGNAEATAGAETKTKDSSANDPLQVTNDEKNFRDGLHLRHQFKKEKQTPIHELSEEPHGKPFHCSICKRPFA